MSDKSFTPPSGVSYELKRAPGGAFDLRREGEAAQEKFRPELSASRIDHQTQRIHLAQGETRKLFWVYARGNKRVLSWPGGSMEVDISDLTEGGSGSAGALKPLKLTMPGKVLSVKVQEGDVVETGQGLLIVEAMKMENLLLSPVKAKVAKVHVKNGDRLESGTILITFAPSE